MKKEISYLNKKFLFLFADSTQNLSELKKIGYTVLSTSLHSDMMILIKNYQESNEIASAYIVSLCDSVSRAWAEIDSVGVPQDLLGYFHFSSFVRYIMLYLFGLI